MTKPTKNPSYPVCSIKRHRRSKADMETIREGIIDVLEEDQPCTLRQVFYRMVSGGLIRKEEGEYDSTIGRLVGLMREAGEIPYGWIVDSTRWVRQPVVHQSLGAMLDDCAETYRRDLWRDQPVSVEVWSEKEALAGVLWEVTGAWGIPLMVSKGYASTTYLYTVAQDIIESGKPTYIYHFGDHDPSGLDIWANIQAKLRRYAPDSEIHFEKVAVTPEQIQELDLLTRPTKKKDPRSKGFEGESVEVDAIPPKELRRLAEECIIQHIDSDTYNAARRVERLEQETICDLVEQMKGDAA